ncbi:hypothetical protein [Rhodococcus sp. NPDC059234]|uniref:hypothetical protein n=1 Tax=Rhodococcus sp. NPDC059234 TaxID=3346781 RepID=UPI00366B2225
MSDDIEKRWNDPPTIRRATRYTCAVIAVALVAMALAFAWGATNHDCPVDQARICSTTDRWVLAVAPAAILLLGGLGAFVRTYRVWRSGGTWPIWQGAGWVLMVLMLVYASMGAGLLVE